MMVFLYESVFRVRIALGFGAFITPLLGEGFAAAAAGLRQKESSSHRPTLGEIN